MAVVAYKCPCCGAGIEFDAEKQLFRCEYCLSEFTEAEISEQSQKEGPQEEDRSSEAENEAFCDELLSYTCDNCGAAVFADPDTVADFCYYCHNPIVCNGRLTGQLRPHKIIPFAYDKDAAKQKFLEFTRKKKFVPRDFFSEKQIEKISGIYFPFWLTDADLTANSSADARKVRTWQDAKHMYTETSYYKLFRSGNIHFEDIATGAFSEEKRMLEGILPYPSGALQDFSMPYLSGYLAKKKNVEKEDLTEEVKQRINTYSQNLLTATMNGYTAVTNIGTGINLQKITWDYSLLPIWVLTYKKGEKTYLYAMNGYTGKVYGELPVSGKKLFLLFLLITLGVTALAAIFFFLGGRLL